MNKGSMEYIELAKKVETEFYQKQGAGLLANLNKKNVNELEMTQEKILHLLREQLSLYQNEDGEELTEVEKDYVVGLIRKELWGYGLIDGLIHDKSISDIKLYGARNIRVKRNGSREQCDLAFNDEQQFKVFVTKLLERNKINLGTANAIQTFTDSSQMDFILRITIISGLLVEGGLPIVAIRKIPKDKYTLYKLGEVGMFNDQIYRDKEKQKRERNQKAFLNDEKKFNQILNDMIHSKGILFTGKGASGKTTLMNAMIGEIPHNESVMICQENAELFDLEHPDLFASHVITNAGDSKISYVLGDLTRAALLVDLDRVIVGEVKEGSEAAGLSKASMTGHKCWTSVHGESCEMAVDKMADYISQATGYSTTDALKQLQGFEYVVHLRNFHVDEIIRIDGWDKKQEMLRYETVYAIAEEGKVNG